MIYRGMFLRKRLRNNTTNVVISKRGTSENFSLEHSEKILNERFVAGRIRFLPLVEMTNMVRKFNSNHN